MEICEADRLLARRSKPSSTLACKKRELAAILSKGQVYSGYSPAILQGIKYKGKEKKEVSYVCFCYCAPKESLGHFVKRKNQSYLYLTLPGGHTSFSFNFTF